MDACILQLLGEDSWLIESNGECTRGKDGELSKERSGNLSARKVATLHPWRNEKSFQADGG